MTLRIKLFTEKMRIAQYADNSIYDYRLKIAQAVLHFHYDCALRVSEACREDD